MCQTVFVYFIHDKLNAFVLPICDILMHVLNGFFKNKIKIKILIISMHFKWNWNENVCLI